MNVRSPPGGELQRNAHALSHDHQITTISGALRLATRAWLSCARARQTALATSRNPALYTCRTLCTSIRRRFRWQYEILPLKQPRKPPRARAAYCAKATVRDMRTQAFLHSRLLLSPLWLFRRPWRCAEASVTLTGCARQLRSPTRPPTRLWRAPSSGAVS